jgi:cytochrome P450
VGEPDELTFPLPRAEGAPLDPPPVYHTLREQWPVCPVRMASGKPAWLVTRYDDVRDVLAEPRFSSDRTKPGYPDYTAASDELGKRWLTRMDPPEHTELRRTVSAEFSVKRMEALRPTVQRVVDDLIDAMVAAGPQADLVADFCLQVPSIVICAQLGVPYQDHQLFHDTVALAFQSTHTAEELEAAAKANQRFVNYIDDLITSKEREPGDDLLSRMAVEYVHAGSLTHSELVDLTRILVVAGFDTTGNTIALGTVLLLRHPEQLAQLNADPSLLVGAVDEILRYTTITHSGRRRAAVCDLAIGDHVVRAGEGLIAAQDAANRDPSAFPDPDTFDIHRKARHHVAFGYGPHACLGAPLARLELQVVFGTLFRRLPGLRLAAPFESLRFKHDSQIYGLYELPLAWWGRGRR